MALVNYGRYGTLPPPLHAKSSGRGRSDDGGGGGSCGSRGSIRDVAELLNPLDRVSLRLSPRLLRRAGGADGVGVSLVGDCTSEESIRLRRRVLATAGFVGDLSEVARFELSAEELDGYVK